MCILSIPKARRGYRRRRIPQTPGRLTAACRTSITPFWYRFPYFNVLAHTLLNNPSVSNPISSSTSFGTITSAGDPHIAQFALKYVF
jgi:hypothetical protein